jgi:hypothetical protein
MSAILFVPMDCWLVAFKISATEQRANITFCVLLYKFPADKLRVYGKTAMKKTQSYEGYKRFRDGRTGVNDDSCFGRPSTSTNDDSIPSLCDCNAF